METGVAVIEVEVTAAGIVIEAPVTGIGDSIVWLSDASLNALVILLTVMVHKSSSLHFILQEKMHQA